MNEQTLTKILFYIDQNIHEKILLTELAALAGYSPFYFSKLFSKIMGMSVTNYIRIRKLQYSVLSLLEGQKVLDVSLLYAFDSHEGFTRSFTQLFGSPPSKLKKFLASYEVPDIVIPNQNLRDEFMNTAAHESLIENMHQLVFEVLSESIKEMKAGHCTKIEYQLLPDNQIRITDNGRGIPLSQDIHTNKEVLQKILNGCPITRLEYSHMDDFSQIGLQTVNSLCEKLHVTVYRNHMSFKQDYVRGIAQHELICENCIHESGMEMILKPDREIFGNSAFDEEIIQTWLTQNTSN